MLKKILLGAVFACGIGFAAIPADAQVTTCTSSGGQVGQCFTNSVVSGSAITLTTTATPYNLTSLVNLPPGHWACQGGIITSAAGTTLTMVIAAINSTSATLTTAPAGGYAQTPSSGTIAGGTQTGIAMLDLTAPTTEYLVVQAAFTGTAPTAYGQLTCWQRG